MPGAAMPDEAVIRGTVRRRAAQGRGRVPATLAQGTLSRKIIPCPKWRASSQKHPVTPEACLRHGRGGPLPADFSAKNRLPGNGVLPGRLCRCSGRCARLLPKAPSPSCDRFASGCRTSDRYPATTWSFISGPETRSARPRPVSPPSRSREHRSPRRTAVREWRNAPARPAMCQRGQTAPATGRPRGFRR